jgi:hypothetical protein
MGGTQAISDCEISHARIRDSIAGDPLSPSFARALLSPVAMNGVMPSGSPTKCLRSIDVLGL